MKPHSLSARRIGVLMFSLCAFGLMTSASMPADSKFAVQPVVEKKVKELPPGPLYWRLENFPTLAQAQGAAGPTSLAAEVAGKVWLFTLGPKDGSTPGGAKVVEIGPFRRSAPASICCASTAPVERPVPRRRSIRTLERRPSLCWPASSARERPTA